MTTPRTKPISVHRLRRAARSRERNLSRQLAQMHTARTSQDFGVLTTYSFYDAGQRITTPAWVKGFRVRKAGNFQHIVEATDWTGH